MRQVIIIAAALCGLAGCGVGLEPTDTESDVALSQDELRGRPCFNVACPRGTTCVAHQVQCFRAPCPPQVTCEPDACAGVKCLPGKHCVLEQVQCVRAPCPPLPICK